MLENIRTYLKQWNKTTEPRARLQQTYLGLAVGIIALAGLVGLFDTRMGRTLAGVAGGSLLVFVVNAIVWALLQSVTTSYLTSKHSK